MTRANRFIIVASVFGTTVKGVVIHPTSDFPHVQCPCEGGTTKESRGSLNIMPPLLCFKQRTNKKKNRTWYHHLNMAQPRESYPSKVRAKGNQKEYWRF